MKKDNMEMIVSLLSLKEDVNNICPRCGGRLYPENPYPYGGGLSVSRLCAVSICPKCGMEEALSDWNRSGGRSTEDFQRYVSGELLEQGKGMEVKARHKEKPRWYECIHYDACGYQEGVTYESLGDKL